MNVKINDEIKLILDKLNITFEIANISQLEEILNLYINRSEWFKNNNIKQWSNYVLRHKNEFPVSINNKNYYILKKDNAIIAGFELSYNSGNFIDNGNSLYLNKVVTKVGFKNLGKLLFMICKDITKNNNKQYLRLDCLRYNNKLNEIYDNYGFKLIGYGKTYYNFALRECNVYK